MSRSVRVLAVAGLVVALGWMLPYSVIGAANLAASYALVAISLVLLTGWVGQISLGHAALVGVGAYATGWVAGGLGIPYPLSLPLGALAAGASATLLGVVALRVRGLYLAVATLVFSWMASEFLFRQSWFTSHDQIPVRQIGGEGWLPSFDFTDRRIFYLTAWAIVATVVFAASNLRRSKTGRAFVAVRGSEMAAASLGIDVMKTKLMAFALSGVIAGAAGNLLMSDARVITADQFTFNVSLFYLAIAVVGGQASLSGAVASALLFAGLTEIFFRVQALGGFLEIVSGGLLAITLLAYRGGLASALERIGPSMSRLLGRLRDLVVPSAKAEVKVDDEEVHPADEDLSLDPLEPSSNGHKKGLTHIFGEPGQVTGARETRKALIEADHVTVRFGGLVAVNDASLTVREGEIAALIGPNGAGKTTLFNSIAGFNTPTEGAIRLFGRDVTSLPVHRRATVGVARTFQAIQLFGQLSVYENLLVATHAHNQTGVFRHIVVAESSLRAEEEAHDRVDRVLDLLSLQDVAQRRVTDLPFGVLRMIEVARALVTGFPVVMLDEPASGLDNSETDRLMEILHLVRDTGVTLLLIEHDVRMVTDVSDYIYVLDQGSIIAEGPPEDIQRDPAVIAAYLGEPIREAVS